MCVLKKYKNFLIVGIILLIITLLGTSCFFLVNQSLTLKEKSLILSLGEDYKENNYHASFFGQDLTKKVKIEGNIDTSSIGQYKRTYILHLGPFTIKKTATITVRDTEIPMITLKGKTEAIICPNQEYVEEGFTAIDSYDGDLTAKVEIQKKLDSWTYIVRDASGNRAEAVRKIKKEDTTAPTITLKGSSNIYISQNSTYQEPGYTAIDACDGDVTSKVQVSGYVNTKVLGSYTLLYIVKDASGNETTVKRVVHVQQKVKDGVIYLTFDDGPSRITPKILDILKEENVKATFFVIHHEASLDQYIKREHDEGHTVALHSYTHNYKRIYTSIDAYFEDLYKIQNHVEKITGLKSMIIRFPGGSSNTVSKFNPKIMTNLSKEVENRGFTYFDWNISSGDAGGARTKDDVYRNVIKNLGKGNNIVLLHDKEGNNMTLNALRDIIQYGKKNGYTFKAIDSTTPPVHHKINN